MGAGAETERGRAGRGRGRAEGPTSSPLLRALDEAFDHRAWHGPNLSSSLRGVRAEEAAWRPGPGRHCIEEIVVHCAYWKHRVLHRIATRTSPVPEAFPRKGRNWFAAPAPLTQATWRDDIALLRRTHAALRETAAALDEGELERPGPRQTRTRRANLEGIALHDVYHAGQIRLLRKLYEQAMR